MNYDTNNIFAKIIRNEIPCKKVYEDDMVIAFYDIHPVAPTHVLVIPKGEYLDYSDFISKASDTQISHYFTKLKEIAKLLGLPSYRIVSNSGEQSGQTVFHFHTHIIGGKTISGLVG